MDGEMWQGWEHVVGCGDMWQGVGTCRMGSGRVWGHVVGVWIHHRGSCVSSMMVARSQTAQALVESCMSARGELHEHSWRAA